MLTAEFSETKQAWIDGRQQANYWKTQHTKAIQREAVWKIKVRELEAAIRRQNAQAKELLQQFNKTIHDQDVKTRKLNEQIEELKAQNLWLKQRIFGRQTEQNRNSSDFDDTIDEKYSCSFPEDSAEEKRSRGQQEGAPGHGRKRRTNLPSIEVLHDLEEDEKYCSLCGLPFRLFPVTQDSEDIHYEIRLIRRIHRRKCYVPACNCQVVPGIVAAPPPARLIPKGMFSVGFWVHILAEKFLFQRPLSRILQALASEGLDISPGTITGGLEKIKDMVYPLYTRILERSRKAKHWHMDETRWMIFVAADGKTGYRWWLWVVVTKDTVVYILDPSRSAQVPKDHLGTNPQGIISADRYSAYKALLSKNLLIAFCWAHVRRDFIRIQDSRKELHGWAKEWINRINELFYLNNQRLEVLSDKDKFQAANQLLGRAMNSLRKTYVKELKSKDGHPLVRKTLESLADHWSGLSIFLHHPEIPMDNNLSERKLREPVLGRKNYYGCGSLWSGDLTAALFTIFQTARLNHLHPKESLKAYLEACAQNQGKAPDNIDDYLPWNLSEKQKSAWQYPQGPPL